MKRIRTLVTIAAALWLFASGCTGPRSFNDTQKATLRQAQVIKVEVQEISAANSQTGDVSKQEVEDIIKEKVRAAGLKVADPGQDFDASLLVAFGFFKMQFYGQLHRAFTDSKLFSIAETYGIHTLQNPPWSNGFSLLTSPQA